MERRRAVTLLGSIAAAPLATQVQPASAQSAGTQRSTRFAVNIEMWWRSLPLLERVDRAAAAGFPAIEFWTWRDKAIDALAARCRQHGLAVTQFTAWGFRPGLNDPANHEAFVRAVREACDVARSMNCELLTVVGGDDRPGVTQEQMHAEIIAGLRLAAPVAEDAGVTLILEPMNIRVDHKGHSLYGSAPAIRICEAVGSPRVKINWDLYHMQITEGDLTGHLREGFAAGQVGYVQLADHPGRHEPGTGEVHYNRVLEELSVLDYRGFVGLECSPQAGEELAARRVAAADVW